MTTTTLQRLLGLGLRGGVATHGGANRRNMLLLIQLRWLAVAGQVATILLVSMEVRHEPPQPSVLALQVLHLPGLVDFEAAVLLAPAVVGLLADRDAPTGLGGRAALTQHDLNLT